MIAQPTAMTEQKCCPVLWTVGIRPLVLKFAATSAGSRELRKGLFRLDNEALPGNAIHIM